MADIVISGLEQFKRDLEQIDFSKRKDTLVKAVLKAAEPIRDDASTGAPVDTGFLSRNIVIQEDKKNSDSLSSVVVDVGATSRAFYGFFQEFGTAFQQAQPFLQPAIDSNESEIESKLVDYIQEEIDKVLTNG